MKEQIENRIQQLQGERVALVDRLQKMEIDIERTRHMISAYDGAIGELSALLTEPDAAPPDDEVEG